MKAAKKTTVAAELERIRKTHGGVLLPIHVVNAARPKSSPLHDRFEWDNRKAGDGYRLWQARQLIRVSVTIIAQAPRAPIRTYVSLMADRTQPQGGYRATVDVLSDAQMRERALAEALEEFNALREKYSHLRELAKVFAAIDDANDKHRPAA